jgi:ribosomal protein L37AE/L43A
MEDSPIELRKPDVCPKCSGMDVRRILYGRPTAESMQRVERGEACLGGCFIQPWLPDWRCHSCRHVWFVADDPSKQELERLLHSIIEKADAQRKPIA